MPLSSFFRVFKGVVKVIYPNDAKMHHTQILIIYLFYAARNKAHNLTVQFIFELWARRPSVHGRKPLNLFTIGS